MAKLLDWSVIRLASRHLKKSASDGNNGTLPPPAIGSLGPLGAARVDPPQNWSLGRDGSFTFLSGRATGSSVNDRVYGRLFTIGKNWADHPTVLLLHGWNAEVCYRRLFPWLATRLRRAGCNTALLELPYHLQRRPANGPVRDFISTDLNGMLEATRQAIADIRTLGYWVQGQGSGGVGLWGFSLGAWLAGITVATDASFRFGVLTTPIARIDRVIAELPFCEPIRRGLPNGRFDLGALNLTSMRPCIEVKNLLFVQARHDVFAPSETVEELWRAWNRPEMWRLRHGHISILLSIPAMDRTIRWIGARENVWAAKTNCPPLSQARP